MTDPPLAIIACPPELSREALSLALCAIAPEQRREVARGVFDAVDDPAHVVDGLFIAVCDRSLRGAAWVQRQPGSTAVLWPPQWDEESDQAASLRLIQAVTDALDAGGVAMTQTLLPARDSDAAPALQAAGFRHLADLLYLTSESATFPEHAPPCELVFESYEPVARERLARLIERSYEGTLDCAELNGARKTEDVLVGYAATGSAGTTNWSIIRASDEDVGALLLAEHPGPHHWELVYVGLAPEFRRRGWGAQVIRHAQWLARARQIERIVLAVDAANLPAVQMYRRCGFVTWDRRSVFVRIRSDSAAESRKS